MAIQPRHRPGIGDPATDAARRRVLEAARSVLVESSELSAFPMDVVAARAGVARILVQRQFGTPAGLLEALHDHLIERSPLARLPEAFELEDRWRVLGAFVTAYAELWEHERVAMRRLRALGAFDSVLGEALRKREDYRRQSVEALVRRLDATSGRPDPRKVDVLCALTSFESLDALSGQARIDRIVPLALLLIESSLRGLDGGT